MRARRVSAQRKPVAGGVRPHRGSMQEARGQQPPQGRADRSSPCVHSGHSKPSRAPEPMLQLRTARSASARSKQMLEVSQQVARQAAAPTHGRLPPLGLDAEVPAARSLSSVSSAERGELVRCAEGEAGVAGRGRRGVGGRCGWVCLPSSAPQHPQEGAGPTDRRTPDLDRPCMHGQERTHTKGVGLVRCCCR